MPPPPPPPPGGVPPTAQPPAASTIKVKTARKGSKCDAAANQMAWRNRNCGQDYFQISIGEDTPPIKVAQVMHGEQNLLGTGATVWPPATVLIKYLERHAADAGLKLAGGNVVDLGSGTGVTGFVAAALGAKTVTVTDQGQILFLTEQNLRENEAVGAVPTGRVSIAEYSWGEDASHLTGAPIDLVLACDCIVPRLYPIEPLVDAIADLTGPATRTLVAYEHREPMKKPREVFAGLARARGLKVVHIPQEDMHPLFKADDLEIWDVTRVAPDPKVAVHVQGVHEGSNGHAVAAVSGAAAAVVSSRVAWI